jgi:mannose-6-phosphate isomerase-like protein (cupin superfamily)
MTATGDRDDRGAAPGSVTRRVEKPWGHELVWAETDRYAGKILVIETGRRLSLQYHERKLESIRVLSGRLRLHLEDESGELRTVELGPGESRLVPVGRRHRFEALERVELFEVSSPELDDVVRVDDDFGREGTAAP